MGSPRIRCLLQTSAELSRRLSLEPTVTPRTRTFAGDDANARKRGNAVRMGLEPNAVGTSSVASHLLVPPARLTVTVLENLVRLTTTAATATGAVRNLVVATRGS